MKKIKNSRIHAFGNLKQEDLLPVSANKLKPKISLEYLFGKFCVSECQAVEKSDVMDTLHRISKLSWQDIIQSGKSSSGYEQIARNFINCPIPKNDLFQSIEKVTVLHRKGKIPIIGFRINETFYIFAIDRNFTAYDHG